VEWPIDVSPAMDSLKSTPRFKSLPHMRGSMPRCWYPNWVSKWMISSP